MPSRDDAMSEPAAGAWEPRQFLPGTRVRVKLSAECGAACGAVTRQGLRYAVESRHPQIADGETGVIRETPAHIARLPTDGSHPYYVELENPPMHPSGKRLLWLTLAGAELAPLRRGAVVTPLACAADPVRR